MRFRQSNYPILLSVLLRLVKRNKCAHHTHKKKEEEEEENGWK
jgi:hypothetical protein